MTKDAFGIPTADWRTWFNGIKGTLTQDVDFFLTEMKKSPQELRGALSSINNAAAHEEGSALGGNGEPPPTGEQEFDVLQSLQSLDPHRFLLSSFVKLKPSNQDYIDAVSFIRDTREDTLKGKSKMDAKSRTEIFTTVSNYLLQLAVKKGKIPSTDVNLIIKVLNGAYSKTTRDPISLLGAVKRYQATKNKKIITRSAAAHITRRNKKNPAPKKKYGP